MLPPVKGRLYHDQDRLFVPEISTIEQAASDSRRRQHAMAEQYVADHHLKLDRQLSFRDLGSVPSVVAMPRKVPCGLSSKPSNTILCRTVAYFSSSHWTVSAEIAFSPPRHYSCRIIQAGVTIVTLVDQRSYSLDSINRNPLDLIISLVSMMRANEESEIKARRVRAVFEVKRAQLSEKPWSSRCPGWLRLDKAAGKFVIVEERAEIVRRVYREALSGVGHQTIARQLNEEQVSLFGHGNQRSRMWQKSLVRHLLTTPTVIGSLVPFVT